MLRPLLAAGLMLVLASAGSSQSPQDSELSPMEFFSNLGKQPQATQDAAKKTDTGGKAGSASPDAAKPDAGKKAETAAVKPARDGLQQCLHDWDAATHMTRQEWARACRRVAAKVRSTGEQAAK